MEKLIKLAEMLYQQIDDAQLSLVHSRLNNDEEGNRLAISEMETAMCNAFQFLKYILERKDNIIDLGEVWHSIDVEPQKGSWFMGQIGDNAYDTFIAEVEGKSMKDWLIGCNIKRWAYIKDLLPKEVKMSKYRIITSTYYDGCIPVTVYVVQERIRKSDRPMLNSEYIE